jgi:uroporphyrinogen-III synthase
MALLIWTRSADDWEHDKPILDATDADVLHLPCLAMTGLAVKFPKRKPQIFIFTSGNAVRYASRHPALFNLMRSCEGVLAIGPGTKEALKDFKVHAEVPAGVANAEQMSQWLAHNLRPGTDVAWPCSKEPSYDIATHLARYDIHVEPLPVYVTEKALHLPHGKMPIDHDIERYIQSLEGVVCFASPSAVEGFTRSLQPSENRLRHELIACCIGQTTASFAHGHFDHIMVAPEQTVESLVATAVKHLAVRR